jgi:heptosyltransferase-1
MSRPLRILIVRIGAMGDVLHGMPAVSGLRAALPECFIGWAVAGDMPLVDRVHLVRTRDWKKRPLAPRTIAGIATLKRELRDEQYDLVVDLQGSIKSAVVGWLAGARSCVGMDSPREKIARMLYSQCVTLTEASVIEQAYQLVSAAIRRTLFPMGARIPEDEEAERWANTLCSADHGPVLLVPQAGWGAKEWGRQNYADLASHLHAAGIPVFVNKLPGDLQADQIVSASGAQAVESTLPQMIALIRNAALVVGGDTGPVHLAAALGTPVVALFGPTDPARNGPHFPWAFAVRVLRHPDSVTDHRRHPETEAGLKQIRVEEVLAASLAMLSDPYKETDG